MSIDKSEIEELIESLERIISRGQRYIKLLELKRSNTSNPAEIQLINGEINEHRQVEKEIQDLLDKMRLEWNRPDNK